MDPADLKEYEATCGPWRGRVWACSSIEAMREAALILSRHARRERWSDCDQRELHVEYLRDR